MRRSIIGCAIVLCFVSPSLFAGDVRVTVRKSGGEKIQSPTATDIPAKDTKTVFEKKKQELKGIVDRIAKLRSHAATIDWGDGTPPPSLTVTIDWGDGTPPSSLTVTNVVARPGGFGGRGIALQSYRAHTGAINVPAETIVADGAQSQLSTAQVGSNPGAGHDVSKYIDQTTPNLTAQVGSEPVAGHDVGKLAPDQKQNAHKPVAEESPRPQDRRDLPDDQKAHKPVSEQGDIRRPQQHAPDEIQKANTLVAEYNSKREAYALEKPSGNYFASLPRLEVDPIELKTNTAAAGVGKYMVLVYKSEGGQWVKQPERTLNTDDAKAATDYVDQVNAVQGWMATTNVPEDLYMHRKLPGRMKSGQLSGKTKSGNK